MLTILMRKLSFFVERKKTDQVQIIIQYSVFYIHLKTGGDHLVLLRRLHRKYPYEFHCKVTFSS